MPTKNSRPLSLRLKASSAQKRSHFPWTRLPSLVQNIVLEKLGGSYTGGRRPSLDATVFRLVKSGYYLANYAAVCSEWQEYFESILFRKVTVRTDDLPELAAINPRRKALIQHLSLHIELLRYGCGDCRHAESSTDREMNNNKFKSVVLTLFTTLLGWPHDKLTLELCAYSPSDAEHFFPHISFDDHEERGIGYCDRHFRDWFRLEVGDSAIRRIFGNPLELYPYRRWPAISCVKRLLISRQTRRHISPRSLGIILKSLPEVNSIHFESWRLRTLLLQREHDTALVEKFMVNLPRNLTSLVLFEDFNEDFDALFNRHRPEQTMLIKQPSPSFSSMLTDLKGLHTFCVSFMADAYDFLSSFREMEDVTGWENLTNLSMTSVRLRPTTEPEIIETFLIMAAYSVLRMPKLKKLELWYGRRNEACLFRFSIDRNDAVTLSRRGTWELPISSAAEKAWKEVHDLRQGRGLQMPASEHIRPENIKTHGHAISHLGLMREVVHPISLQKIKKDAQECSSVTEMTLGAAIAVLRRIGVIPYYIP